MGSERKCVEVEVTKKRLSNLPEEVAGSRDRINEADDTGSSEEEKPRVALPDAPVDESNMLQIINRMQRVGMIMKVTLQY